MPDLNPSSKNKKDVSASAENLRRLFRRSPLAGGNDETRNKRLLFLVGIVLFPVTLIGALVGYVQGYKKFMDEDTDPPKLAPLSPIMRAAMVIGAVAIWLLLVVLCFIVAPLLFISVQRFYLISAYAAINFVLCLIVWARFAKWQRGILDAQEDAHKFGSARYAKPHELAAYVGKEGFYIGGGYTFADKGHILTVGGTRSGKGTGLIIPNLLGYGGYQGSWVVIDPKGENAAVTARFQREAGQDVVILNPWGLLEDKIGAGRAYNPLDILKDTDNDHLIDDVQMIAEMIVPIERGTNDKFFSDNARSIVAGLLLHLAVMQPQDPDAPVLELRTLWEWVRLPQDDWRKLLEDMNAVDDERYGNPVMQAANEIEKLMLAGDKTWGSIIAVVLQCTDFLKSPALQQAMISDLDPKTLSDGKTTLYVIIPADKLQSHARWLRLVVTTTMRAVVRNPNKRVCFLLDEFSALGYLPEIEVALSTYAGFEITVWAILQSLVQLRAHYRDTWETFIGNSTIRQYLSINDNFTAKYISDAVGMSTYVQKYRMPPLGFISRTETTARLLITPDEVRRGSGKNIFAFFGENPVTYFPKVSYLERDYLVQRADPNPYFLGPAPNKKPAAPIAPPQEVYYNEPEPAPGENQEETPPASTIIKLTHTRARAPVIHSVTAEIRKNMNPSMLAITVVFEFWGKCKNPVLMPDSDTHNTTSNVLVFDLLVHDIESKPTEKQLYCYDCFLLIPPDNIKTIKIRGWKQSGEAGIQEVK